MSEEDFFSALFRWATIEYGFFQKPTEELRESINDIAYEFYLAVMEDDNFIELTTVEKDSEANPEKLADLISRGFAALLSMKQYAEELPEEPQEPEELLEELPEPEELLEELF